MVNKLSDITIAARQQRTAQAPQLSRLRTAHSDHTLLTLDISTLRIWRALMSRLLHLRRRPRRLMLVSWRCAPFIRNLHREVTCLRHTFAVKRRFLRQNRELAKYVSLPRDACFRSRG